VENNNLLRAVQHASGRDLADLPAACRSFPEQPVRVTEALGGVLTDTCIITGTISRRLLIAKRTHRSGWTFADLSGRPLANYPWPAWSRTRMTVDTPGEWLSSGTVTQDGARRLLHPNILLVALYHPEHFPLPRFPLGISDLARAVRSTLMGRVRLMDMQLGVTLDDIILTVQSQRPDILGVSATFGQHDLMIRLLDRVYGSALIAPLVVAGGSLTVRNERMLLERYPALLIARTAGEQTMADLVSYWHDDISLAEVRGIGYEGAPRGGGLAISRHRHTAAVGNQAYRDIFPELDLLDSTFEHKGVAQLETSRGCTNYCSFCPRGHKGSWASGSQEGLPAILTAMSGVFDRYPGLSRTLYLVDEEFIGRGKDAVPRALSVARTLHGNGFGWESSCRVDQVVWLGESHEWHVERARMWRALVASGLRRMLFGVESGVTSILQRFNKETTAEQNVYAIRLLSALGVPTRFTYITFDHLMNIDELRESYAFQSRRDLLLSPLPALTADEIVRGIQDESFVQQHTTGRPFYTAMSYLLVSMECLTGAAYTKQVQAAGLSGASHPSMGRIDARFLDWQIGACSCKAQSWIDRNFALDYTLKSLEKILDGQGKEIVRDARVVLKQAAFTVFSRMLDFMAEPSAAEHDLEEFESRLDDILEAELAALQASFGGTLTAIFADIPEDGARILRQEHERWRNSRTWLLINAADPCGT
jgi:hypothetical protein